MYSKLQGRRSGLAAPSAPAGMQPEACAAQQGRHAAEKPPQQIKGAETAHKDTCVRQRCLQLIEHMLRRMDSLLPVHSQGSKTLLRSKAAAQNRPAASPVSSQRLWCSAAAGGRLGVRGEVLVIPGLPLLLVQNLLQSLELIQQGGVQEGAVAGLTECPALLHSVTFPVRASTQMSSAAASRETMQESTDALAHCSSKALQQRVARLSHCTETAGQAPARGQCRSAQTSAGCTMVRIQHSCREKGVTTPVSACIWR